MGSSKRPSASARRRTTVLLGAGVGAAALVAAITIPIAANAGVDLPDKTPEELLSFAQSHDVDSLSGTIEQSSELGLPDLGALLGGEETGADDETDRAAGVDDALSLLTGSHTADVYLDGERARLQVFDSLAERNVYVDGDAGSAWFVDSETQTATRFTLTGDREGFADDLHARLNGKRTAVPTPETLLDDALTRLDETTEVTVGTDGRVAGREAYELILQPRTDDTLVDEVRFAIDGETGVPLAASLTARGASDPAFELAFTEVLFSAPDPSTLAFSPAAGVEVVEHEVPLPPAAELDAWMQQRDAAPDRPRPIVHGEGWSTVVEVPTGSASVLPSGEAGALLARITRAVDGGRVLETALVTVLLTDDGRVLAGAVPAEHLVGVAAGDG